MEVLKIPRFSESAVKKIKTMWIFDNARALGPRGYKSQQVRSYAAAPRYLAPVGRPKGGGVEGAIFELD